MKFGELKNLVLADLYRYEGRASASVFFKHFFRTPGFRYTCGMRLCTYLSLHPVLRYGVRHLATFFLYRMGVRFGIGLPYNTRIGSGLYIGHFGGIVVNDETMIGRNCNLSHDVTIGQTNRGERRGSPSIGDNVYIASGARIIGRITIGNNVAIGANAVVTKDVPDNAVVAGVPAKIISMKGSGGYVNRIDYEYE